MIYVGVDLHRKNARIATAVEHGKVSCYRVAPIPGAAPQVLPKHAKSVGLH